MPDSARASGGPARGAPEAGAGAAAGGPASAPIECVAALLGGRHGLRFDGTSHDRLRRALEAAAAARGARPEAVALGAGSDAALADELVDRATLPESSWFRDPAVFARVAAHAAAAVAAATAEGRRAVLWSAGCAHGQEPCSLAIALLEAGATDFEVVATDVAPSAVARTAQATYGERELRGLDRARRTRWLEPAGAGRWRVVAAVRERVRARRHGLAEERPPVAPGSCDLVLCRNVLIYLDAAATRRALGALRDALRPGGLLVLGSGESLLGDVPGLHVAALGPDAYAYERGERRRAQRPRSPRRRASDARRPRGEGPAAPLPERPVPGAPPVGRAPDDPGRSVAERLAAGERAAAGGDHAAAAAAFRHAAALDPDAPVAHLGLGLALEALGDPGALRAFRAAWAALERGGAVVVEGELGGFRAEALARLLADKLTRGGTA